MALTFSIFFSQVFLVFSFVSFFSFYVFLRFSTLFYFILLYFTLFHFSSLFRPFFYEKLWRLFWDVWNPWNVCEFGSLLEFCTFSWQALPVPFLAESVLSFVTIWERMCLDLMVFSRIFQGGRDDCLFGYLIWKGNGIFKIYHWILNYKCKKVMKIFYLFLRVSKQNNIK